MARRSAQSQPSSAGYRLFKQRPDTRVSYWPDPRGPGHGTLYWGTVVEHFGDEIEIVWDFDDSTSDVWDAKEARYRVDRGQMRFIPPPKERRLRLPDDQIFCKVCGKPRQLKCGCPRPGALKPEEWGQKVVRHLLTPSTGDDMMVISNEGNALNDEKGAMMARKPAAAAIVDEIDDEIDDLTELAEASDDATEAADDGGDMLTAKAAATKLGTDARTLRKFLRKKQGTVGQGQRWAISADDIPALKAEFDAWAKGARSTEPKAEKAPKAKATKPPAPEVPDADELEEIDDLMEELDDLDFDED